MGKLETSWAETAAFGIADMVRLKHPGGHVIVIIDDGATASFAGTCDPARMREIIDAVADALRDPEPPKDASVQ